MSDRKNMSCIQIFRWIYVYHGLMQRLLNTSSFTLYLNIFIFHPVNFSNHFNGIRKKKTPGVNHSGRCSITQADWGLRYRIYILVIETCRYKNVKLKIRKTCSYSWRWSYFFFSFQFQNCWKIHIFCDSN